MTAPQGGRASGLALPAPVALGDLVARHGGAADEGAHSRIIRAISPIERACSDELAPLSSRRYLVQAHATDAVVLVDASLAGTLAPGRRWVHPHAGFALAGLLAELDAAGGASDGGSDGSDAASDGGARLEPHVGARVRLARGASLGPGVVILGDAEIGEGTRVEPNAVIYGRVRVGARVLVGAGAVIGRPGFGWAHGPAGEVRRMPHLGGVVVADDVEIGALATVDAGTLGPTTIGRGAKLDAHVHVGHNVVVGAGTFVAAQSGFGGSVIVGEGVLVGGQAGVADHVRIGAGARLAAQSGVIGDVPPGRVVAGYPAVDRARWLRAVARMLRLPR